MKKSKYENLLDMLTLWREELSLKDTYDPKIFKILRVQIRLIHSRIKRIDSIFLKFKLICWGILVINLLRYLIYYSN
jgi:hypothetical protein